MRIRTYVGRSALALWLVMGVARSGDGPAQQTALPEELKRLIDAQQKQIEQLQRALQEQMAQIDRILAAESKATSAPSAPQAGSAPAFPPAAMGVASTPDLFTRMDSSIKNLAGFTGFKQDSGSAWTPKSGRVAAGLLCPCRAIRGRYRFRMNIDKDLDRRFSMHAQLSTGPLSNANTNDQDFGGITVKAPFSLSEAYINFSPNANVQLRGGRMEEVFADNMRFLWDDDVRFNGFQQRVRMPIRSLWMGISSVGVPRRRPYPVEPECGHTGVFLAIRERRLPDGAKGPRFEPLPSRHDRGRSARERYPLPVRRRHATLSQSGPDPIGVAHRRISGAR